MMFLDPITPEAVVPLLPTAAEAGASWIAGRSFEYLPSCASTNAALKDVADGSPAGATLITDEQTKGRGRSGNTWVSEPGRDLTFSVLLRPRLAPEKAHLLALAAGVAVAEVLEEEAGLAGEVALKWPNDVLLGSGKVGGILLEAATGNEGIIWAVAGIGLNVNSEPARLLASLPFEGRTEWRGRPRPVSLREQLGEAVLRAPLLAALLVRLTSWWTRMERPGGLPGLLAEWRRRDALFGHEVEVGVGLHRSDRMVVGEAQGIGEDGGLLVRTKAAGAAGPLVEVFAGEARVTAEWDRI